MRLPKRRHIVGFFLVLIGVVFAFFAADPRIPDAIVKPWAHFVSKPLHDSFLIGGLAVLLYLAWRSKDRAAAIRIAACIGTETAIFAVTKGVTWFGFGVLSRPSGTDGGFPSGHTAASVVVAWLLSERFGAKWSPVFYGIAAAIGWSRVADGAHFAYQVLGGAVLGFGVSYLLGSDPMPLRESSVSSPPSAPERAPR